MKKVSQREEVRCTAKTEVVKAKGKGFYLVDNHMSASHRMHNFLFPFPLPGSCQGPVDSQSESGFSNLFQRINTVFVLAIRKGE